MSEMIRRIRAWLYPKTYSFFQEVDAEIACDIAAEDGLMDYGVLLLKYIRHVEAMEGTTFIEPGEAPHPFSPEEWAELQRLGALEFNFSTVDALGDGHEIQSDEEQDPQAEGQNALSG